MHKICFTISLFHASTCLEDHVLIVRRSKLYYTASGIITPIGGRPVHLCTYRCDDTQWCTEGRLGCSTPPRNSEGPLKSCQTQPDCENC